MEKKNNSGLLVGILIGIIIMLLVIIVLFVTGTISFAKTTNNNEQTSENNQVNIENTLSEVEALKIVKTKFDFTIDFFDRLAVPCGENEEIDNSIPYKNGNPYYKSKQFHSYDELNQYLLQYMSSEVLLQKDFYKKEYYFEKDGNLYCLSLGKGSGDPRVYVNDKTEYQIDTITTDLIACTVKAYYETPSNMPNGDWGENYFKTFKITLVLNNNNWQITKYEEQK